MRVFAKYGNFGKKGCLCTYLRVQVFWIMTFINCMATEKEESPLSEKKVNVFDHLLVPKHTLLSQEEVEKVLNKYRIKPYQLPKIKDSDPAAMAIQAQSGDVIKILRKSHTAGEAIAYRYVVEG